MHQGHNKSYTDQPEEKLIVFLPHTVIDPTTVMVETIDASITLSTMLG